MKWSVSLNLYRSSPQGHHFDKFWFLCMLGVLICNWLSLNTNQNSGWLFLTIIPYQKRWMCDFINEIPLLEIDYSLPKGNNGLLNTDLGFFWWMHYSLGGSKMWQWEFWMKTIFCQDWRGFFRSTVHSFLFISYHLGRCVII